MHCSVPLFGKANAYIMIGMDLTGRTEGGKGMFRFDLFDVNQRMNDAGLAQAQTVVVLCSNNTASLRPA